MRRMARTYDLGTLDRSPIELAQRSIYDLQETDKQLEESVLDIDERILKLEATALTQEVLDRLDDMENEIRQLEKKPLDILRDFELRLENYAQKMSRLNMLHKEAVQNAVDAIQSSRLDLLENPPGRHDAILGAVLFETIIAVIPYSFLFRSAMKGFTGLLASIAKKMGARKFGSQKQFLLAFDKPRREILRKIKKERSELSKVSAQRRAEMRKEFKEILDKESRYLGGRTQRIRQRRSKIYRIQTRRDKNREKRLEEKKTKLLNEYRVRLNDANKKASEHAKKLASLRRQARYRSQTDKEIAAAMRSKAAELNSKQQDYFAELAKVVDPLPAKMLDKGMEKSLKRAPQIANHPSKEEGNPPALIVTTSNQEQDGQSDSETSGAESLPTNERQNGTSQDKEASTFYDASKLPLDVAFKIYVQNFWDNEVALLQEISQIIQKLSVDAEAGPTYAWDAINELIELFEDDFAVQVQSSPAEDANDQNQDKLADIAWSKTDELQLRHELTAHYELIIWSILLENEYEFKFYRRINNNNAMFNYKELTRDEYIRAAEQEDINVFMIAVPAGQDPVRTYDVKSGGEYNRKFRVEEKSLLFESAFKSSATFQYIWQRFGNNKYNPTIETLALRMKEIAATYNEKVATFNQSTGDYR